MLTRLLGLTMVASFIGVHCCKARLTYPSVKSPRCKNVAQKIIMTMVDHRDHHRDHHYHPDHQYLDLADDCQENYPTVCVNNTRKLRFDSYKFVMIQEQMVLIYVQLSNCPLPAFSFFSETITNSRMKVFV